MSTEAGFTDQSHLNRHFCLCGWHADPPPHRLWVWADDAPKVFEALGIDLSRDLPRTARGVVQRRCISARTSRRAPARDRADRRVVGVSRPSSAEGQSV